VKGGEPAMQELEALVQRASRGDVEAYGDVVRATERFVLAIGCRVLRDPALAEDAAQETFLRAYRRLPELADPAAFPGWLRRIAVTVAINLRRSRRRTLLRLEDVDEVPVLDEAESHWSEGQRQQLAAALFRLSPADRRLCDRRYHGGWSADRLAAAEGIEEAAMRKRMQRIRDRLRKEIEMAELRDARLAGSMQDLPARIVELLARPRLTDLPENPVGATAEVLRSVHHDAEVQDLPEIISLTEAGRIADDAVYIDRGELHRVDSDRILRYDLTLPMLMAVRYAGAPLRLWSQGKAYRHCQTDATHMEAFHQAEVLWVDEQARINHWDFAGRVLRSVEALIPGAITRIAPTTYPMCRQAWELEIEHHGRSAEVLAWGIYSDAIVRHLGADPARHLAIGLGYGLDRLAAMRYDIDDIRRVELARVG
jgi:RNA polymerase sigma-70 factor, ECF subfamily